MRILLDMADRHVNLINRLNPWYLEEDGVVFLHKNGVEVGLQFWLPEASSVTTDDVDTLFSTYQNILEGCGVEKGRIRFMTVHRPATEEEIQEMDYPETDDVMQQALIAQEQETNEERVARSQFKVHETFAFIHLPDFRPGVSQSDQRSWSDQDREEIMVKANDERDRIISALSNAGIAATPLIGEDPFRLMWRYYQLGQISDNPPAYIWEHDEVTVTRQELMLDETIRPRTLRSQVITSDLITERNEYLENGDAKIVVADMTNYGEDGFPGLADKINGVFNEYTYIHVVDVVFTNESAIKNRVERNITAAEKLASDNGRREDVARSAKMSQEAMQAYYQGGRFVRFGMSMIVVCDDDQEVRKIRNRIRNEWNNEGNHQMSTGRYSNWEQFAFNLAPFGGGRSDFLEDQQVGAIPNFLPFYGPWFNTGGVTLGVFENAYGGQQRITLPKTSEAAPHMCVIGSSRSGKSFTIQKLLMNLYMQGASLRVMDIKNDYAPLVAWLGGQFIPCEPGATFETETTGPFGEIQPPGTPVRYNIFSPKLPTDREPELSAEDQRDIIAFLKALLAFPLNKEEDSLLQAAVKAYTDSGHQKREVVFDAGTPQQRTVLINVYGGGNLGEFVNYLFNINRIGDMGLDQAPNMREIARQLAIVLQNYTQGVFGMMFNGSSTINVKGRVAVYDMSRLGTNQSLIGAVTTMINKSTWESAKKRRVGDNSRIVMLSEESGVTGKIPEIKEMLNTIILSGAAYNLMEIIVAQNYEHIEALGGILNNISRIIMGRSAPQEAKLIAEMLEMNSEQEETLKTLTRVDGQYNELLVRESKPDGTVQVGKIRYRPTDLEYALFSSDPSDKTRRAEIMEQSGGDMLMAVRQLVAERRAKLRRSA